MISFHGDEAIKEKYLARVLHHRELDHLVQGIGWESNGTTKGCAVGCTLEAYDHSRYPIELGIPTWLAHLEDRIFEGLPVESAMEWPERFLRAIPVGVDLEPVRNILASKRLDRLIALQTENLTDLQDEAVIGAINETLQALQTVRACHEAEIGGDVCDFSESARSAWESAAESAAESARSAAQSAWEQEAQDLVAAVESLAPAA